MKTIDELKWPECLRQEGWDSSVRLYRKITTETQLGTHVEEFLDVTPFYRISPDGTIFPTARFDLNPHLSPLLSLLNK
jgi:hypothetical protein